MHEPRTPIEQTLELDAYRGVAKKLRGEGIRTLSDLRLRLHAKSIKTFLRETQVHPDALRAALGGSLDSSAWPYFLHRTWNCACIAILIVQLILLFVFFRNRIESPGFHQILLPIIVASSAIFAWSHQTITRHFALTRSKYFLSGTVFMLALMANSFAKPVREWLLSKPTDPEITNVGGFFSLGKLVTQVSVTLGNGTFAIDTENLEVVVSEEPHRFAAERESLLPLVERIKNGEFRRTGQRFDPGSTVAVGQANMARRDGDAWRYQFCFKPSNRVRYWAVHDAENLARVNPELEPFVGLVHSLRDRELVFEASTAFGVYVLVKSSDGYFIVSRRGQDSHTKRAIWTSSVNQGLSFDRDCKNNVHHRNPILNGMYATLHAELGIPQSEVSSLKVLAVGYDRFHHYGAVAVAHCWMSSDEIQDRIAALERSEIGQIEVLPTNPEHAVRKMLQLGKWDDGAIVNIVLALIFENNRQGLDVSRRLRKAGIERLPRVPS